MYNKQKGVCAVNKRNLAIIIIAIIGLICSIDLVYIFIKTNFLNDNIPSFCTVNNFVDCDGVAKTNFSVVFGIPLAIWGVILYLLFLFLALVDKIQAKLPNTIFKVFKNPLAYISTIGFLAFVCSMTLAGISVWIIQKVCILCVATYFLNLAIAIIAKNKTSFAQNLKTTIIDFWAGVKEYTVLFIACLIFGIACLAYLTKSNVLAPNIYKYNNFTQFSEMSSDDYKTKGNTLGNKDGIVKVYIYSDFHCPYCKITNKMFQKLAHENKNVEIMHVNFPLDRACNKYVQKTVHGGSCELARYAIAAREQGDYWGMISELYGTEKSADIEKIAKKLDLNYEQLKKDANSEKVAKILNSEIELCIANNINVTPTYTIDGIKFIGGAPYEEIKTKVRQAENRLKK